LAGTVGGISAVHVSAIDFVQTAEPYAGHPEWRIPFGPTTLSGEASQDIFEGL